MSGNSAQSAGLLHLCLSLSLSDTAWKFPPPPYRYGRRSLSLDVQLEKNKKIKKQDSEISHKIQRRTESQPLQSPLKPIKFSLMKATKALNPSVITFDHKRYDSFFPPSSLLSPRVLPFPASVAFNSHFLGFPQSLSDPTSSGLYSYILLFWQVPPGFYSYIIVDVSRKIYPIGFDSDE